MRIVVIGLLLGLLSAAAYSAELYAGDINQDKHVTFLDLADFAADWQTSAARSDIVSDGIVDLLDLMQLSEDWLKSSNTDNPEVTFQISGAVEGQIVIELYADQAPITVENFIHYVQSGFYEGLIFHRVSTYYRIIQSGSVDAELNPREPTAPAIINESSNRLPNLRGTIGMARTSAIDSATSGFFFNYANNTYFDFGYNGNVAYCVFGEVLRGMDVVDEIAAVETTNDLPDDDVIIQSAWISYDIPFCAEKMSGDVNGDCDVDLADFAAMAENWMLCNSITGSCS